MTCLRCGKLLYRYQKKFCSIPCMVQHKKENQGSWGGHTLYLSGNGRYMAFMIGKKEKHLHVAIAEEVLGKPLPKGAVVHHVDGNSLNNEKSNLVILQDRNEHARMHAFKRVRDAGGDPKTMRLCQSCGTLKHNSDFHKAKANKVFGLRSECKACR